MIRYTMREKGVENLGPGRRAVVWVHGCKRDCPGCIATSRNGPYAETTPEEMCSWYLSTGLGSITVSGGEPFLQSKDLACLIHMIRRQRPETDVIVYTGYTLEEILSESGPECGQALLDETDLLIDGPYIMEQDRGRYAIGSENQKQILLKNDRLSPAVIAQYYSIRPREVSLHIDNRTLEMIGVPDRNQAKVWRHFHHMFN